MSEEKARGIFAEKKQGLSLLPQGKSRVRNTADKGGKAGVGSGCRTPEGREKARALPHKSGKRNMGRYYVTQRY